MGDIQIDIVKDEAGGPVRLVCKGAFVGSGCNRVKEKLLVVDMSSTRKIEFDLEEVVDLDLAFLQVLYSFLIKLADKKIAYKIYWPKNEELTGLIKRSGLIFE